MEQASLYLEKIERFKQNLNDAHLKNKNNNNNKTKKPTKRALREALFAKKTPFLPKHMLCSLRNMPLYKLNNFFKKDTYLEKLALLYSYGIFHFRCLHMKGIYLNGVQLKIMGA